VGLALIASPAIAAGKYDPGASDTEIKIGNTNPYSGPLAAYSTIGKTIKAYFDMVNEKGGINGRKINFISLDDSYSPPKTKEVVRRLVEQEKVLLTFQNLGTPTNTVVQKYLNKKKVPQLFVATGATKWANPKKFPWTMGWQPNYQTEAQIYGQYILKNVKNPKVGVLYQNDDYGKDYLHGLKASFAKVAKQMIVKEVPYETTDPSVKTHLVSLKGSGANVFLNFSTPKFAVQSIVFRDVLGWKAEHYLNNVSANIVWFSRAGQGDKAKGLARSKGIISTQYIKDPLDPANKADPGMQAYRKFLAKYNPKANADSGPNVYAYTVAQTMVQVLKQAGDNLTRANIMKQAASLKNFKINTLLEGITINTSATDFRPIEQERLVRFNGKVFVPISEILSSAAGS
jgi:branched-chain amino acid transport system substrate-binding protein